MHGILGQVDSVVGAFATTGGFLATPSASAREYVRMFGGPQTFSSAITPVQSAVALSALRIVTSPEGAQRRAAVAAVVTRLRTGLTARGLEFMGDVVCPVVPVLIGDTPTDRTASGLIAHAGLIAHLVEQPAVASDASHFRLQAMADHGDHDVDTAIDILDTCIRSARQATASTRLTHTPRRRTGNSSALRTHGVRHRPAHPYEATVAHLPLLTES
ncbi:aminotransferase class I/II-fold pyridoxal phosphate-dependent enzyme [Streptomyces sp. R39]|uniref:8-amino-7-oxononanoate synthase n=1 Tax=Streptomyces sp. R39 TaxID=3238631 RepID=A0AB39QWS8_9ACTN